MPARSDQAAVGDGAVVERPTLEIADIFRDFGPASLSLLCLPQGWGRLNLSSLLQSLKASTGSARVERRMPGIAQS